MRAGVSLFGRPIGMNQGVAHTPPWRTPTCASRRPSWLATYHAARLDDAVGRDAAAVGIACNSAKYLAAEGISYAAEYDVER